MKSIIVLMLIYVTIFFTTNQYNSSQEDNWFKPLPDCPCTNPDSKGIELADGWAKDKGNLSKYHIGATECFRSYPYIKTSAGNSCQQCCYDKNGNLIKTGSGAGTPDKVSTCAGEDNKGNMKTRSFSLLNHYFKDVKPWNNAGSPDIAWKTYNKRWVPNQGNCNSLDAGK